MTHNTHTSPSTHKESVSQRVLETIEEKKINPKPRWEFLLKRSVVWGAGVASVIVGGAAVSAALFSLSHNGLRYYAATHHSFAEFIFSTLPYLWIVVLALFSGIAYYNIRHTEGGYRYPFVAIISLSILGSVALGVLLFSTGFGKVLDERTERFAPFYKGAMHVQEELWERPEAGLLAGTIESFSEESGVLTIETFDGDVWTVLTDDLREPDLSALQGAGAVRIIGVPTTSAATLHACFIFPWDERGLEHVPPQGVALRGEGVPSESERNAAFERSNECKEVRPYQALIKLQTVH